MSVEWNEMAVMIAITPQKERRPSMVSDGRLGPAKKRYRVPGEKSNLERILRTAVVARDLRLHSLAEGIRLG